MLSGIGAVISHGAGDIKQIAGLHGGVDHQVKVLKVGVAQAMTKLPLEVAGLGNLVPVLGIDSSGLWVRDGEPRAARLFFIMNLLVLM